MHLHILLSFIKAGFVALIIFGRLGTEGFTGDNYPGSLALILLEFISGGLMFLAPYLAVSKIFNSDMN